MQITGKPIPKTNMSEEGTGLYGMGVVQTRESFFVTGGFDKPYWKSDMPWIYFYNRSRAQKSIFEFKCAKDVGCKWTKLKGTLKNGRGHHVSFIEKGSQTMCTWVQN